MRFVTGMYKVRFVIGILYVRFVTGMQNLYVFHWCVVSEFFTDVYFISLTLFCRMLG